MMEEKTKSERTSWGSDVCEAGWAMAGKGLGGCLFKLATEKSQQRKVSHGSSVCAFVCLCVCVFH